MKEDLGTILKKHNIKSTKAKLSILDYMLSKNIPLSIEEIFKKVKGVADYSTVFRTLVSFEKAGIVKKVTIKGKASFYEVNLGKHHHHHLICESCGKIEDLDICISNIEKKTLGISRMFDNITSHSVEFYGVCKKCVA